MSLVFITNHNENIFDVEGEQAMVVRTRDKYVSKYNKSIRANARCVDIVDLPQGGGKLITNAPRSTRKTMGYAETPLPQPSNFLRKHQGIRWRRGNDHVCPPGNMPPVPRFVRATRSAPPAPIIPVEETAAPNVPVEEIAPRSHNRPRRTPRANFIRMNIQRARTTVAHRPPPRYVDTPHGDTHPLLPSGLLPQYICRQNFGRIPGYLQRWAVERSNNPNAITRNVQIEFGTAPNISIMPTEERRALLNGLRLKRRELTELFQRLPLLTDTVAKILRKNRLEHDLRTLEQDIHLLESNTSIYVNRN